MRQFIGRGRQNLQYLGLETVTAAYCHDFRKTFAAVDGIKRAALPQKFGRGFGNFGKSDRYFMTGNGYAVLHAPSELFLRR